MISIPERKSEFSFSRRWLVHWSALLLIIGGTVINAYVLNNYSNFDIGEHPDEPGKLRQILDGSRNFTHPPLMIELIALISKVFAPEHATEVDIAILGRFLSNVIASLVPFALAIAIRTITGKWAYSISAYLFFWTMPWLALSGRYIKEDVYSLFAISIIVASLAGYFNYQKALFPKLMLGVGLGCAISAKYAMTLYLIGGIGGVFLQTDLRRSFLLDRRLILATATATTIVLNFTLLFQFDSFLPGLKGEIDHALSGHGGVSWPATSTIYAKYFVAHFSNIGAACAVLLMVVGFNNLPRMDRASRAIFVFCASGALIYGIGAQLSPLKISPRYIYPIFLSIDVAAVIAAIVLIESSSSKYVRTIGVTAVSLIGIFHGIVLGDIKKIIHERPLAQLRAEVDQISAEDTNVLSEYYAGFSYVDLHTRKVTPTKSKVKVVFFAAKHCLKHDCSKYDFIILSSTNFDRFLGQDGQVFSAEDSKQKRWYEELFAKGRPIREYIDKSDTNYGMFDIVEENRLFVFSGKDVPD